MTRFAKGLLSAAAAAALLCGCILPAYAAEAEEEARVLQYETAEPVSAVTANVENVELIIQTGRTDKITVESSADAKGEFNYVFSVEDGVLTVDVDAVEPEESYSRETDSSGSVIRTKYVRTYENTVTVTLPEKTYASLYAEVDNGSIGFTGVEADALQAEVRNGHVEVQDVKADTVQTNIVNGSALAEDVKADTVQTNIVNGSALAEDVTAGTLRTEVGNGKIKFRDVTAGTLYANMKTGNIGFDHVNASAYECEITTGNIEGTLTGDQAAYRIAVDLDWNWAVSSLEDQPGDGSGKSIDFHVHLGNVDVSFTD